MNKHRILLVGEKDEVPHVSIRIDEKGEILFFPLIREGWSFAASMYIKSKLDCIRWTDFLPKKFERAKAKYGIIPKDKLIRKTIRLAKALQRQRIHLGNQDMIVKMVAGKTRPPMDPDRFRKRLQIRMIRDIDMKGIINFDHNMTYSRITKGE